MRNITVWNDSSFLSPWRGLMDIQRNFDRLFDHSYADTRSDRWEEEPAFYPPCEMEQTDSHYVMNFDVPGVAKKDITIEVKDNQLLISGERKSETKSSTYSERSYGKFRRAITLPQGVDTEKIEAHYQDGVLSLAVPRAESAKPRQIKISEGKNSFFGKLLGGNKEGDKEQKTVTSVNAA